MVSISFPKHKDAPPMKKKKAADGEAKTTKKPKTEDVGGGKKLNFVHIRPSQG